MSTNWQLSEKRVQSENDVQPEKALWKEEYPENVVNKDNTPDKCPAMQRAVWRNGGSNSAESDVRTWTEVARRTCSESRRFAKPLLAICKVLEQIAPQEIVVSDVVCAELYFGARNKQELAYIVSDMERIPALSITPNISKLAVDLVKQYCLSHKLKLPDALIAATALTNNANVLTLNKKDFSYIPNLKLYEFD